MKKHILFKFLPGFHQLLCLIFIVILFTALKTVVHAEPNFTGNVPSDFTDSNIVVLDDLVGDVGVPSVLTGTTSGWDVNDIYFQYDYNTDTLYVGIDCVVICGDADGNGDPSSTSAELASQGGTDFADFGSSESFILLIDTSGTFLDANDFDVVVGINSTSSTINNFGIFNFNNNTLPFSAAANFGTALANPTSLFLSPNASSPDLEFTIASFSTLPGFSFNPREAFSFNAYYFNGSVDDDGIGEDSYPGTGASLVQIEGVAAIGDYVWIDENINGIQDTGELPVAGVTVNLFDDSNNLIATTFTDSNGLYMFDELVPGDYYLQFSPPAEYIVTPQDNGADDLDSDVNVNTGTTIVTNLIAGEFDQTWDLGLYQLASIGDYVWLDQNANGIQEIGESPVEGVPVNLYDSNDNLIASTTTNINGLYNFIDLIPGDYYVNFLPPAGFKVSPQDIGADNLDSDVDSITGNTVITNLVSGENDITWDMGLFQPASIGDYVWFDTNANGIQEPGELPVGNIPVNLFDSQNNLIGSTTTNSSGFYLFDQLTPGDYFIQFDISNNYIISPPDQGNNISADSDINHSTLTTPITTLISGENDMTWDAGVYQLYTIGDTVWHDDDHDNFQDQAEMPIAGVVVTLIQNGQIVATTTTNANGNYSFEVLPGNYSVSIPQQNFTSGPLNGMSNTGLGNSRNVRITDNDNINLDFGYDEPIGQILGASTSRVLASTGEIIPINLKTRILLLISSLFTVLFINRKLMQKIIVNLKKTIKLLKVNFTYIPLITLCILLILTSPVNAEVAFTGNAQTDFADSITSTITDTVGDVGMPGLLSGSTSGWDISHIYLQYDPSNDTLYVGINCVGICGDADGDGDPNATSSELDGLGGADHPNFGDSESFILLIDTDNDFNGTTGYDVVAGINSDASTLNDFGIFNFSHNTTPWSANSNFGSALSNPVSLANQPSTTTPDLEFTIGTFSTLPGFTFEPGEAFQFGVYYYNGSLEDDGIGEDSTSGSGNPTLVSIPIPVTSSSSSSILSNSTLPNTASDRGKLLSAPNLVIAAITLVSFAYLTYIVNKNKVIQKIRLKFIRMQV